LRRFDVSETGFARSSRIACHVAWMDARFLVLAHAVAVGDLAVQAEALEI
jgi:hypothetical protein